MKLLKDNEEISLSGQEAVDILVDIEYVLISLRDIARYYYDEASGDISIERRKLYCEETTKFIDENEITNKLAKIREVITNKFNLDLGEDDMDDIERALEGVNYWKPKG
ncbi:hypothetical protein [Serratia rubidaea]|uniref:hypothetical protein n=1 Tax=Serratia rubidaea TaxID=61652 RepID=UPI003FA3AC7A